MIWNRLASTLWPPCECSALSNAPSQCPGLPSRLRVHFDARVRLELQGANAALRSSVSLRSRRVTSDAGLLAVRELDDALGSSQLAERMLRTGETSAVGSFATGRTQRSVPPTGPEAPDYVLVLDPDH